MMMTWRASRRSVSEYDRRRCGIEYVYTPQNKYKLKFKLSGDGQQRFTRAETLGEGFTIESITEHIAEIQEKLSAENVTPDMLIEPPKPVVPKTKPKPTPSKPAEPVQDRRLITEELLARMREQKASQATQPIATTPSSDTESNVITIEEFLAPLYDKPETPTPVPEPTESKAPEKKKEDPWDLVRGMRDSDKMIAELEAGGITSLDDLKVFFWNFKHPDDHTDELAKLRAKIEPIDKLIAMME